MEISFELTLVIISLLFLVSVVISKISDRLGVPLLLLFLGIGMLAGSEGIGGIYFDDPHLTQYVGVLALAIILFSSGLDTKWNSIKPVFKAGISLSTIGVMLTAILFGLIAYYILKLSILESLLIGAIISSTDAAAVFSILRSRGVNLKPRLTPLLELESGSNDPVAVILTTTLISFITNENTSVGGAIGLFALQIAVGILVGWIMSKIGLFLINKIKLGYEGLYNILLIGLAVFAFSTATILKGSGFLAIYLFGVLLGKEDFIHKRSILRFFDSTAWFSQIVLFLTLGLLVFPSRLIPVALPGLGLALCLVLLVRPLAVLIALAPFRFSLPEKLFVSWVGLRGAVPIVLATFPLVAGLENADLIFNIVFFVVFVSVLLQGTLLPKLAKLLKVEAPGPVPQKYPLEMVTGEMIPSQLKEIIIPLDSPVVGKPIVDLKLPPGYLIVLIARSNAFIQPNGGTIIQADDKLLALTEEDAFQIANEILAPNNLK